MTACNIVVYDDEGNEILVVYKHTDGYPYGKSGMIETLTKFVRQIKETTTHRRLDDANHVAAQLVVFLAAEYNYNGPETNFISVYVVPEKDLDYYQYELHCNSTEWVEIRGPVKG